MTDTSDRPKVGVVKPTKTSNSFQDLVDLMPGVEFISRYLDIRNYSVEEFETIMPVYDRMVAELAAEGVDLIHPEGAPPFMIQGLQFERERVKTWLDTYQRPVFTTGMTQLAAMKALGIEKFMGLTPFLGVLADAFTRYFTDAGFEVLAMGRPTAEGQDINALSPQEIYDLIVRSFKDQPGAPEALYILGSNWRAFDVIDELERELGVPLLHPVAVRCWYISKQLGMTDPISGHGRLLAEMP
ncbi:MAG: hypothetical protein V3T02_11505 [Alphaproteobacteria bacterium]